MIQSNVRISRRVFGATLVTAVAAPVLIENTGHAADAVPFPGSGLQAVTTVSSRAITDGVKLTELSVASGAGVSRANLVTINLRVAETGLLSAPTVASAQRLDDMAEAAGALVAINADFFQNTVDAAHKGVPATSAPVGVEIVKGRIIKSAVPEAQRHGETMPNPVNRGNEVVGVRRNGRGIVTRVELDAYLDSRPTGMVSIDGLNVYGMGRNQISAFDAHWGAMSRQRIACGTEQSRTAPCTTDVVEVIVTKRVVTSISSTIGAGQLGPDQLALVGREAGAEVLRKLAIGDRVKSRFSHTSEDGNLEWAVAGGIVVADGQLAAIVDRPLNPRSYAGVSADGFTMYLLTVDGRDGVSVGVSTRDGADLIRHLGADDALLLDGGGSATMLVRPDVEDSFELVSRSSTTGLATLRPIANGIGVFPR